MIRCVIIDDEKPARDTLELMLKRYFVSKVEVVALAASLKEGVLAVYENKPDLVFLDIEMPGEDGFKIFSYFQQVDFSIIFVTAYSEYAIKAIKVAALDYIMKPVGIDNLKEAIALFEKKKERSVTNESIIKLISALNPVASAINKVALPTLTGFQLEKVNDIMYCEADQNYTRVFTSNDEKLLVSKPLSAIEDLLPKNLFYRIHKSFLVNLNFIKTFSRANGSYVILENGTKLDVAGRRKNGFIVALTNPRNGEI